MAIAEYAPISVPRAGDPLLRVEGVVVSFGERRALDRVELAVRTGEVVALAGENGAGKSTLVRCIAGDIVPEAGRVLVAGEQMSGGPPAVARAGVSIVWQDLALCNNLDIAANLLLGRERRRLMLSDARFYARAKEMLDELGIDFPDLSRSVGSLSGGQRQLLVVARAMRDRPRLLVLDEPTGSLGVNESAQVEELTARLRQQGTTILFVSHDIDQLFRLSDRILVMRHGRIVADVDPAKSHPEEVVALISGQESDASARRQISRLHRLADQLASADPSSSLSLILSALGAALGTEQLCIHLMEGPRLVIAASLGLPAAVTQAWKEVPVGPTGGPVGAAAATERVVAGVDARSNPAWAPFADVARDALVGTFWSVPVIGAAGVLGVITVFRAGVGRPARDELDLVTVYAGYAASAIERDRLLSQLTARNRVLETIREVLETLAGPASLADGNGLEVALRALRSGLQADEVALLGHADGDALTWLARAGVPASGEARLTRLCEAVLADRRDGEARRPEGPQGRHIAVSFPAPDGPAVLLAGWNRGGVSPDGSALLEDAANCLRLALERAESERVHQEATTLRRSQHLQRQFLSRLSHELRTPLTAIRGYASSLMQTDVTWDADSQTRFLFRIASESARLGRLVDDLLDFSAIEANILRLQRDWCELPLVLDAARACLPPEGAEHVHIVCPPDFPVVWADHDRLEQVFVNLIDNALRHNPPGTRVDVTVSLDHSAHGHAGAAVISVSDNGAGVPQEMATTPFEPRRGRRSPTSGAGLGLSIAKGIVDAHGGRIDLDAGGPGTRFSIRLPIESGAIVEAADA